jgi:hypothetical protein
VDGVAAGSMRTDLVCAISAFGDLDWSATFQLFSAQSLFLLLRIQYQQRKPIYVFHWPLCFYSS